MADRHLLAYLQGFVSQERRQRFEEVLQMRTNYLTVAIEDVFQMHNTSAVLRSCESFGLQHLHLVEARFGRRIDEKIAMGAQKWVNLKHHPDAGSCLGHLKDSGYRLVATTPAREGIPLSDYRIDQPTALLFGTEKEGLSETMLQHADDLLRIPLVGFTESLNISVAAAIIIQKLISELRQSDLPWQLGEEEKHNLRMQWTRASIKSLKTIIKRYHSGSK